MFEPNWQRVKGDALPPERSSARLRDNLCLRCGVRVWLGDMAIHDGWHEALEKAIREALGRV